MTTFDADAKNDLGPPTDGRVTAADDGSHSSDPVDHAPDAVAMSESALAEAARKVADNPEVKLALQAVVDLAMANCSCDGRQRHPGRRRRWSRNDGDVRRSLIEKADDLQYAYDEGPCLRAAEDGGAFLILDTAHRSAVSGWGPDVANLGLNSVLSIHLFTDHRILGALNLYYESHDDFSDGRGRGGQSGGCTCFGRTGQAQVGAGPVAGYRLPASDRAGAGHPDGTVQTQPGESVLGACAGTRSSTTSNCTRSPVN